MESCFVLFCLETGLLYVDQAGLKLTLQARWTLNSQSSPGILLKLDLKGRAAIPGSMWCWRANLEIHECRASTDQLSYTGTLCAFLSSQESHWIALANLELMQTMQALNSQRSFCLYLLSSRLLRLWAMILTTHGVGF